jgi:hypothetical protein
MVTQIVEPTTQQIDALALELASMGVRVPPRDTAFFHAVVRKWFSALKRDPSRQSS